MALSHGTIVVADLGAFGGSGGLIAVDRVSGQQATLSQGGLFVEPCDAAFAADGSIVVSDIGAFGSGGLIAVDPESGQQSKLVSSTVFLQPYGLAVEADGRIAVAYMRRSDGPGALMRIDPANGEHTLVAPGVEFIQPAYVALDAAGNLFVTDPDVAGHESRLYRFERDGAAGALAVGNPLGSIYTGVAVEPSGSLVVANGPNHSPQQLLRFHPTSGAVEVVSEGGKLVYPLGVAVEADGKILVVDRRHGVVRLDPGTGAQTVVSTGGSFVSPTGIAIWRS